MAHYADKISILFKLAHLHFNDLKRMQSVSPWGQNWLAAFSQGDGQGDSRGPPSPWESSHWDPRLPWLRKDWLGGSGGRVIHWLRADHKRPINLLLADTFSISRGGITDFEAISQRNELESGQTGGRA